jgi:small subunit ribosomal protein S5
MPPAKLVCSCKPEPKYNPKIPSNDLNHEDSPISNAPRSNSGGGRKPRQKKEESGLADGLVDRVVKIKRCAAVVKGGRRFSFAAMVVVGDAGGKVGWGYGKANEVPPSVQKAQKQASRSMIEVPLVDGTIPHLVKGHFGAAKVILIPAGAGTGIIAGQAVRAVCEATGIHDILTKSFGTNNPVTLVKATVDALSKLRTAEQVAALRGLDPAEMTS